MNNRRACGQLARLVIISSLLCGCAVSSVFNPYPNQAQSFRAAITLDQKEEGNATLEATLAELAEKRSDADAMLYTMERGRLNQLASNFDASKSDFELVISRFEEQDLAATLSVSSTMGKSSALLTNDNAIPYTGAPYERLFVHHHQAMNYWGLGDLSGAEVEFRKLALEQQILLEQHEKEIAEAEQQAEENDIKLDALQSEFAGLDVVAGQVKSSFQNAYSFYTSAAFWEARGELNNALVDYKKAYEINPDSRVIAADVTRVASRLGENTGSRERNMPGPDQGTIVLLYEDGFLPAKTETKISVPTFDSGIVSVAFPYYETRFWQQPSPLLLRYDATSDLLATEPVQDFGALAVKNLKENLPGMITRQVLRAYTKYQMQKQSHDQLGALGGFAANLYNIISESADRRSWLTLPRSGQVQRFNLNAGPNDLRLTVGNVARTLNLNVEEGRTQVIRVVHVNNELIIQKFSI